MGLTTRHSNRGPAAAGENRRALLRAARSLFAERGYNVPLSVIARTAGVGQAVLYRHFPQRLALAFAVFEENFAELEALSTDTAAEAFERFFARMVELMVESFGFVELIVGARGVVEDYDGGSRLAALIARPLARAQTAGRIAQWVTVEEVALGLRMIYGVAATARDTDQRLADVARVQTLVAAAWMR